MSDIPKAPENYPAFQIPLTTEELSTIGLIAVVWGQIDILLDDIILYALEIDADQKRELIGDAKPFGAKLGLIAAGLNRIRPKETRAQLQFAIEKLGALKVDRNAIFHACWGFKLDRGTNKFTDRAALFPPRADNPVRPERLKPLFDELSECSRLVMEVFCDLKGWPRNKEACPFTWGGSGKDGAPSERLQREYGPFSAGRPSRPDKQATPDIPPKPSQG